MRRTADRDVFDVLEALVERPRLFDGLLLRSMDDGLAVSSAAARAIALSKGCFIGSSLACVNVTAAMWNSDISSICVFIDPLSKK